jgi:DNA-binding NtrC family response regulator
MTRQGEWEHKEDLMLATSPPIRVLLITEHALIRAGLRLLLERQPGLTVVADTAMDTKALAAAAREHPDMILLDVDRGGHSDFALLPELLVAAPETRVRILTDGRDPEVHQHAVRLGALAHIEHIPPLGHKAASVHCYLDKVLCIATSKRLILARAADSSCVGGIRPAKIGQMNLP